MFHLLPARLWLALLWAILTVVSLLFRPLFPVDETRYVAVAWEMWNRNDFLVPYLNGETYSHKPPLLFWLMQLSWGLFGVNDWSHRFVAPLFSLASLYLAQAIAKGLWPDRRQIAEITPFILLGFFFWMVFGTLTMFDIPLSFFVLLGIHSLLHLIKYGFSCKRWLILGVSIGGGVLTKGPVILLHLLPLALISPYVLPLEFKRFRLKAWYLGLLFAVLSGALLALCWAIPAGLAGGQAYQNAIFFGQASGRIVDSFAHKLPFWWYLQMMPIVLLPWLLMRPIWVGIKKINPSDLGCRFCLAWLLPVFIAFSLVSGKRIHYLLPLMPAMALLLAWVVDQLGDHNWRPSQKVLMLIFGFFGLVLTFFPWLNEMLHWLVAGQLSPLWGIILIISAVVLGMIRPGNVKEAVLTVCIVVIVGALAFAGGFFQMNGERYDIRPASQQIARLVSDNKPVAIYAGKYHGQFHFYGRLTKPIDMISNGKALRDYVSHNPEGFIILEHKETDVLPEAIFRYRFPFKSRAIGIIPCKALINNKDILLKLRPS